MGLMQHPAVASVSLDQQDKRNSIDDAAIARIGAALDRAEQDPDCRIFVITGSAGVFSTGMDLQAAGTSNGSEQEPGGGFFDLLTRLSSTPRIVVALVDGTVAGGGVGLVSASDLVYCSPDSTFALPEALWGLLPCVVLPFLARRIGFHKAYTMTLTTQPVPSGDAMAWGLVDTVADDPTVALRPLAFRAGKLDADTIGDAKRYANALDPVGPKDRDRAVDELRRLMSSDAVQDRLATYATSGQFPWES